VTDAAVLRPVGLEHLHLFAESEGARRHDMIEGGTELVADAAVLAIERDQRHMPTLRRALTRRDRTGTCHGLLPHADWTLIRVERLSRVLKAALP
jgi:hypothetical protein